METLSIKGIDVVTAFLNCTEADLIHRRTIYKDFIEVQDKFEFPDVGVRLYNLGLPNQGFQLTLDLDKDRVISQRTFYSNLDVIILFDNLTRTGTETYKGRMLYNNRLQEDIFFNLEEVDSHLTIKSDIYV